MPVFRLHLEPYLGNVVSGRQSGRLTFAYRGYLGSVDAFYRMYLRARCEPERIS